MKNGRRYEWQTHLSNTVTMEGMADEHLANTIQFIAKYYTTYSKELLKEFKKEAKRNGLGDEFLGRAPFPYKDGTGNWIIWDFDNHCPTVIGSYLRSA